MKLKEVCRAASKYLQADWKEFLQNTLWCDGATTSRYFSSEEMVKILRRLDYNVIHIYKVKKATKKKKRKKINTIQVKFGEDPLYQCTGFGVFEITDLLA